MVKCKKKSLSRVHLKFWGLMIFLKLFSRCKMVGFVVKQNFELLSSVLKFLKNGFVTDPAGEGPKLFGHCNNLGLRVQRELKQEPPCHHGCKQRKMLLPWKKLVNLQLKQMQGGDSSFRCKSTHTQLFLRKTGRFLQKYIFLNPILEIQGCRRAQDPVF